MSLTESLRDRLRRPSLLAQSLLTRSSGRTSVATSEAPEAGEPFVWRPLRHEFAGTNRVSCNARVSDSKGFTGNCGLSFSSPVHLQTERASELVEQVTQELSFSAQPEDHVSAADLEVYLRNYGKLDRLEAQRIAHLVTREYDLFPKGLLLIWKGLDNMPSRPTGTPLR